MTRWLNGWVLTGAIVTPLGYYTMNGWASPLLFLAGGTAAVTMGTWIAAKQRGRLAGAEAILAGSAFVIAACVYVAAVINRDFNSVSSETSFYGHESTEYRQFLPFLYAVGCLALFGGLFGFGAAALYKRNRAALTLGSAGATLLAGFLIFYASLFLAAYNLLRPVFGPVWEAHAGLILGGMLGTMLPGTVLERLLVHDVLDSPT